MATCNHYYLIDALNADGQPVRKRKYRREDSKIQTWWFDWRNLPIDDAEEKARVEALATTHTQIDEGFEEDARFMQRVNKVGSIENLPMDAHVIEVAWAPNGVAGELSFSLDKGLDGDTYKVLVTNTGDHPATLFLPRVADTIRMSTKEGEVDNTGTTYILLYPSQVAYVEAAYNAGKWTFSMTRATAKDLAQHVIPAADWLILRFNWNRESGDGLDTSFVASGTGIAALDNKAVGYQMEGNTAAVNAYMEWGGENTGSGKENTVIKLSAIKNAMSEDATKMALKGYATWFTSEGGGLVTMEMFAYSGGELVKDGTVYRVEDGTLVWSGETDLMVKSLGGSDDYKNKYDLVFMLNLDKETGEASVSSGASASNTEYILDIIGEAADLSQTITDIQSQITNINKTVTSHTSSISAINQDITTIKSDVSKNKSDISGINTTITQMQKDITANESAIDTVEKNVSTNTSNISSLTDRVTQAETKIQANTSNITSLTNRVTTNEGNIKTNTQNISSLTNRVSTAENNISTNTQNISKLTTRMTEAEKDIEEMKVDISQALCITLSARPTSSTVSYASGDETVPFVVGAFVRYYDSATGSYEFFKLANLAGSTATWVKMYDTKYGNVSLETTYNKGYEILNVTGGSRVTGVSSDLDYVKVVNSSSANITVAMNQSVASGVRKFTSPFDTGDLVLTPGASATFVKKDASSYILTDLFGITMFPDLADANREGEWAMTVSPTGKPQLMEIADIRKWDESIVARMSIDGLNEKFPDAPLGFAVVCKTIGKIYEKVNGYNEWVETDITNTPSTDADI